MRVTSTEFVRNYGSISGRASVEPVTITRRGRDWLVLLSVEEYNRLKRRDRRVFRAEDISDEDLALIEAAVMEPGHEHLDEELEGWQP